MDGPAHWARSSSRASHGSSPFSTAPFSLTAPATFSAGSRYSTKCSARDSFVLALVTFGEGYHNYHHEFQYDYRNGVKPWNFDPTKWIIWTLSKIGFTKNLRRVPREKIQAAELERAASL